MSANFYAAPSVMSGAGFTVYGGYRRQRGAGIFGSFRKYMAPIGRQALSGMKTVAANKSVQNMAKQAAAKGAEVLTGVAIDAIHGRNVGDSFQQRGREVALRALMAEPPGTVSVIPIPAVAHQTRKRKARSTSTKRNVNKTLTPKRLKQSRKRAASINSLSRKAPAR